MNIENKVIEQQKEYYVIKDNVLNESISELSLNEYKLLLIALSRITPTNVLNPIYLEVKNFSKLIDIEADNMYSRLKQLCRKMQGKTLLIYLDENNKHTFLNKKDRRHANWETFNWFHVIRYKNGIIEIEFHDKLKPYLLNLKQFTKYKLKHILNLQSKYSIRIYELCSQYYNLTPKLFQIEDIKLLIGANIKSYDKITHLRRMLDKCIQEISTKTDIHVIYDIERLGRSCKLIKFTIKKQSELIDKSFYYKVERTLLINKLQNQIYQKTGHAMDYKKIDEFHRYAIISVVERFDKGGFDNLHIQHPNNFFLNRLEEGTPKKFIEDY